MSVALERGSAAYAMALNGGATTARPMTSEFLVYELLR